jgi:glycosyltransferase involved in cell wall biosynthesis
MRILHCIPGLSGGGTARQLTYLAGALGGVGWDTHVIALSGGPNPDRLEASGARLHQLTARESYGPRVFGRLVRTMRAVRPDLVQVWLVQMEILGGLAATALGVPWIVSERSSSVSYHPSIKHWLRVLVARRAAAVVSNSAAGDAYWRPRVSSHVARYIVPNAVPLAEIDAQRPAGPEETGIETGHRLILFAGRLCPEKNLRVLLPALRVVLTRPKTVAVLCGEGPLRAEIERRLTDYGIRDRVRLPGYVTNIWRWMKRADVLVAPSLVEGHPNAVLEAMACRCPLVVSDLPEHREFLDETTASLVNPHDVDALAKALLEALSTPAAATARARNARTRVAALSISSVTRQYAEVYAAVLAAQDRRRRGIP